MTLLITFLDLHVLLWASSFQGATLDFFLVTSFCTVAVAFKNKGRFFWIATIAALVHILSIQPLFFGMALGWTALSIPTVILLTPTFMLYIWFASSDPRAELTLAKQKQATIRSHSVKDIALHLMKNSMPSLPPNFPSGLELGHFGNNIRNKITNISAATAGNNFDNYRHAYSKDGTITENDTTNIGIDIERDINETKQHDAHDTNTNTGIMNDDGAVSPIEIDIMNSIDAGMNSSRSASVRAGGVTGGGIKSRVPHNHNHNNNNNFSISDPNAIAYARHRAASESAAAATAAALIATQPTFIETLANENEDMDDKFKDEGDAIQLIIQKGLFNTKHFHNPSAAFKKALLFAIVGSVLDEIFLIFAPCLVDTSFLCK